MQCTITKETKGAPKDNYNTEGNKQADAIICPQKSSTSLARENRDMESKSP